MLNRFLILICLAISIPAKGHTVLVSLYNDIQVQSAVVSGWDGEMTVSTSDSSFVLPKGRAINVVLVGNSIVLSSINGFIGLYERVAVRGTDGTIVRLRPSLPLAESRNYEGIITLYADLGRLRMINSLDEGQYLAGVIEAETGAGRTTEFYKAFAVICRTYLYGHAARHLAEGFHLCDGTHCQAYKGLSRHDARIQAAVAATGDLLIVDEHSQPIQATYMSNCGGETESARNAWQTDVPYLTPARDPYCTGSSNARWEKTISLDRWIQYLMKNGFSPDPARVTDFNFQQITRQPVYRVNDFVLPFKQIRNDWGLRSSFFSVSVAVEGGVVRLSGRGYGHGVGLCQEGAMEMGKRGFQFEEIIRFYYKNVRLVPASSISVLIPEI